MLALFTIEVDRKEFANALRIVSFVPAETVEFCATDRFDETGKPIGRLTTFGGGKRIDRDFVYISGSTSAEGQLFGASFSNSPETLKTVSVATTEKISLEFYASRLVVSGESPTFRYVSPSKTHAKIQSLPEAEELLPKARKVGSSFLEEIGRCVPFAEGNSSGYFSLTGILIETEGKSICLSATNGKALVVSRIFNVDPCATFDRFLLDKKDVKIIQKAFDDHAIFFRDKDTQIEFRSLNTSVRLSLLEGRFPNWRSIDVAKSRPFRVRFSSAVKTARDVAAAAVVDKDNTTELLIDSEGCFLTAIGTEVGEAKIKTGGSASGRGVFRFDSDLLRSIFDFFGDSPVDADFSDDSAKFTASDEGIERFAILAAKI